jgi:hypothetical protein
MGRVRKPRTVVINDPDGEIYGFPTYRWGCAPEHLMTRRQLSTAGLRKNGQDPVAQMLRARRGKHSRGRGPLRAYLYDSRLAAPKRPMTAAKWEAVRTAARSKFRCGICGPVEYVPRDGVCESCREAHPYRYAA